MAYYGNDDYYYYDDAEEFTVTSEDPGINLLIYTALYTLVCIVVGFSFRCNKKKDRERMKQVESNTIDGEAHSEVREEITPNSCSPCAPLCGVEEVVTDFLFDNDEDDIMDEMSIITGMSELNRNESDVNDDDVWTVASSELDRTAPLKVGEFILMDDGSDNWSIINGRRRKRKGGKKKNVTTPKDGAMNIISEEGDNRDITPRRDETPSEVSGLSGEISNALYNSKRSGTSDSRRSAKPSKPRFDLRRGLFGKRNKSAPADTTVEKLKKKKKKKRRRKYDRILHSASNIEIEMKEGKFKQNKRVKDSFKYFEHYDDPYEVDRRSDAPLALHMEDHMGRADDTYENEMKEMYKLAGPWAAEYLISYLSSLATISLISNHMSVAEMICYSYVWFILGAAHIVSSALYNSAYKHVNNASALESDSGYEIGGIYIRMSIAINFLISVPASIAVVVFMGNIMRMYGYGDKMVELCTNYSIIAAISNFASVTSGFITCITDIEGHADFNAVFALADKVVVISLSFLVIPAMKPTLIQLGLIYLSQEFLSTLLYYYLTWYKNRWYDGYKRGILDGFTYERKDKKALATLLKKLLPMTLDQLNEEFEWLASAYFAAYLGNAETTSWILLSYLWSVVDVIPSCIGSATEYRVSHQLSKGNIELARQISKTSLILTGVTSSLGMLPLFIFRHPIAYLISNDDQLAELLVGVTPYIVLCQPLISLTSTAAYLNRALAMYQRSTKIELAMTTFATIPMAWLSTYHFGWNISGLVAAAIFGYATMGSIVLAIYMNADWEKAVGKNRKIAGIDERATETTGDQVLAADGVMA